MSINNTIKTIFAALLMLVVGSCSSTKEHANYRFAKGDFTLQQPTSLRTDGVYIETTSGVNHLGDTIVGYSFYRFYKNGRCFASHWQAGEPNLHTILLTTEEQGQRTYYRNDGNNIVIEAWGGNYTGYIFNYGKAENGKLTITAYKGRGFMTSKIKYPAPFQYIFEPMDVDSLASW